MRIIIDVKTNPFGISSKGFVFEYLKQKQVQDIKLLDFGCRDGDFLNELVKHNVIKEGLGVDLDGDAVEVAQSLGLDQVAFKLIQKNHKFDDGEGSFDVVTIIGVVEHVYDQVSLLRELTRVLKVGGLLIIAVPGKHLFSFLDMANFKFRFKGLHRFYYTLRHSRKEYKYRYVNNPFGCVGDIEIEKSWHEHFSERSMQTLIKNVGDLNLVEIDGYGFFHRILNNLRYFLPNFGKRAIDKLISLDSRLFHQTELCFVYKKI